MNNNNKIEEFQKVCDPVIKWINKNCHPHAKVIIEVDRAELIEGVMQYENKSFIKD